MSTGKLDGKVAVVTGGSSGIGLATAKEFRLQGAKVVISGRKQADLDAAVEEIGDGVLGVQGDVSNLHDLERLFQTARSQFGKVDVLFVNAGIFKLGGVGDVNEADFDALMGINFKGAFFTVQKALSVMNDNSSIILNGTINSYVGFTNMSVYSASKAAVHSLARTLSAELAGRGIRVNTITIGPIDTPLFSKLGLPQETLQGFANTVSGKLPMKRFGNPDEIAKVALFLASSDSSFITGSEITADGGLLVNTL